MTFDPSDAMPVMVPAVGVRLPNSGPFASAAGVIDIATTAASLGYRSVWVHDHISWGQDKLTHFAAGSIEACQDQDPNFYESLSTIAFLAGRFPELIVGVAGLVLPLRDPRLLAKQLSTLDNLTAGRVIVAAAIGNIQNDFDVVGVAYKRRARITEDYLCALAAILADDSPVAYSGEFISFTEGTFHPRPLGLRLWLAGSSDPGLLRAVRYGDGWLTVYQSVAAYAALSSRLAELAEAADRDPATIARGYETFVSVAETRAEALSTAHASMARSFGDAERGAQVCLIGTPADITERMAEYRASGAQHFELKFYCRSLAHLRDQLGLLAQALRLGTATSSVTAGTTVSGASN